MRAIKFRSWDKKSKKMRYVDSIAFERITGSPKVINVWGVDIIEDKDVILHREKDAILLQFTGLNDKNGIPIYEDDIVHVYYGVGKVVFNAGCFMIAWLSDREANMELLSMQNYKTGRIREDLVVTGNIWENPEMLNPELLTIP
jgi:uncharacterized phage protein (TIGR01671 family)